MHLNRLFEWEKCKLLIQPLLLLTVYHKLEHHKSFSFEFEEADSLFKMRCFFWKMQCSCKEMRFHIHFQFIGYCTISDFAFFAFVLFCFFSIFCRFCLLLLFLLLFFFCFAVFSVFFFFAFSAFLLCCWSACLLLCFSALLLSLLPCFSAFVPDTADIIECKTRKPCQTFAATKPTTRTRTKPATTKPTKEQQPGKGMLHLDPPNALRGRHCALPPSASPRTPLPLFIFQVIMPQVKSSNSNSNKNSKKSNCNSRSNRNSKKCSDLFVSRCGWALMFILAYSQKMLRSVCK